MKTPFYKKGVRNRLVAGRKCAVEKYFFKMLNARNCMLMRRVLCR